MVTNHVKLRLGEIVKEFCVNDVLTVADFSYSYMYNGPCCCGGGRLPYLWGIAHRSASLYHIEYTSLFCEEVSALFSAARSAGQLLPFCDVLLYLMSVFSAIGEVSEALVN